MPDETRNIYKTCRKAAELTQEAAAERLGISVESLRAYETGQRVPPDEVVADMFGLYNTLHLIVQHVRKKEHHVWPGSARCAADWSAGGQRQAEKQARLFCRETRSQAADAYH